MSGPQGGSNQISGQGNPGQMNGQGISLGITTTTSPDTTTSSINVIYQIFHSSELLTDKSKISF
jgi:hypothetical protein